MRTIREVCDWCTAVEHDMGDPAASVAQVFARYVEDVDAYRGEDLVFGLHGGKAQNGAVALQLRLWVGPAIHPAAIQGVIVPATMDGPKFALDQLLTFGVRPVSPGLWYLNPSLNLPGQIHAFIVLYDVPTPAPWDKPVIRPNDPPLGICDNDSMPHWVGRGNHNEFLTACRNWRPL